jgi:hypothetical protein
MLLLLNVLICLLILFYFITFIVELTNLRGVSFRMVRQKVKCTLLDALRLCTGRTAHRGSRGIALLLLYHGIRRGRGVSVTPRPLFTPGKNTLSIVLEAGWATGSVWTGAENLAPTGIRSPDRPAPSQSLYRLRYPARSFRITCE